MARFNIYQREMYDMDYTIMVLEAETKEEALSRFIEDNHITEEDEWLFYATDADRFICHECGKHFDYPESVEEGREYWGMPCTETVYLCPHCGSGEFEEVKE